MCPGPLASSAMKTPGPSASLVITKKIDCPPPPQKEEPDDLKPALDIQRECSYDWLYSPSVAAVTRNSCENFDNQRYC